MYDNDFKFIDNNNATAICITITESKII